MTIVPDDILKLMSKKDRMILGKAGLTKDECQTIQLIKSERELQNQIASMLRLNGIAFCQPRTDKRSTMTVGWPDFTFCVKGYPIAFECKTLIGKLSKEQEECHKVMTSNGWHVYVIRKYEEAHGAIKTYKEMAKGRE